MTVVNINQFTGLNTHLNSTRIEDTQLSELVNFDVTDGKYLAKRPGTTFLNLTSLGGYDNIASDLKFVGAFYYAAPSINYNFLFFSSRADNKTYYMYIDNSGVPTSHLTNFFSDFSEHAVQYDNALWSISLGNSMRRTDPVTPSFTLEANTPTGDINLVYKARMFTFDALNESASVWKRNRVYFSKIYTVANRFNGVQWDSTTQYIEFGDGDGDIITGMVEYKDLIYVFKHNSIWTLNAQSGSPSSYVRQKIVDGIGCFCRDSIVEIDGLLYFVDKNAIWRTDGNTFEEISLPIRSLLSSRAINVTTVADSSYRKGSAMHFGTKYVVAWVDLVNGFQWLVFDTVNSSWTTYNLCGTNRAVETMYVIPNRANDSVLFTTPNDKFIYRFGDPTQTLDALTSSTTAIVAASAKTKLIDFDSPMKRKKAIKAVAVGTGGVWTCTFSTGTSTLLPPVTSTFGVTADVTARPIKSPGIFRALAFRFQASDAFITEFHGISLDILEKNSQVEIDPS